jgi:hypothetical protein
VGFTHVLSTLYTEWSGAFSSGLRGLTFSFARHPFAVEEELKWVEDNIPTGGDGGYGGPSDDISLDINGDTTRHRLL